MLVPVLTGLVLLVITHLWLKSKQRSRAKTALSDSLAAQLPGGPEAVALFDKDPRAAFPELAERYGKTFMLHVGGVVRQTYGVPRVVATCDPDLVKEIFRNKLHTVKRPERYKAGQMLPGLAGVLWMDGPGWVAHTRALKPVFQP